MAEYTIPKPYRDFYVTDPYVATQKEVEELQEYSYPHSQAEYGSILHGENTLPDKEIPVKVESKNIIPFPYKTMSATMYGGTLTAGEDGGITGSGTPSSNVYMYLCEQIPFDPTTNYQVSLLGTFTNIALQLYFYDNDNAEVYAGRFNTITSSISIPANNLPEATKISVVIKRAINNTEMTGTCYPQIEKGDTATSYALYQAEGTPVTVTTCGKNLLNVSEKLTFTYIHTISDIYIPSGKTVTVSCADVTKGGSYNPALVMFLNESVVKEIPLISNQSSTYTAINGVDKIRIYSNSFDAPSSQGVTSTVNNLMIEIGHKQTSYEKFYSNTIETEIGKEIVCRQLNDITNIITNNANVSLSSRFVLYNEELFHDKLTAIIGVFADRPTDIVDFDRLYIATDKTDTSRSTILPAGKSGATASNWIYI